MAPEILWSPREILTHRSFRLPVRSRGPVTLVGGAFRILQTAPPRDGVTCFYLAAPAQAGTYPVTVTDADGTTSAVIGVRTLEELRSTHRLNDTVFPRRWPLGGAFERTKRGQTFVTAPDFTPPTLSAEETKTTPWILSCSEAVAWAQLPPSEMPRGGSVNAKEGCPRHGTALFAQDSFHAWRTQHEPGRALCQCPIGEETYPSNRILENDFISGDTPDDGFGYLDSKGNLFTFVSCANGFQINCFSGYISHLTNRLIALDEGRPAVARRLGLLLARQAVEELYLAAVPQFRHGSHVAMSELGLWGPADTVAISPLPRGRPYASGTIHYHIAMPSIASMLAVAYDAAYPWLCKDRILVTQLQALGVSVSEPADVLQLIEEMLAAFIQHHLDGYSSTNCPGTSVGTLICLRVLDRPDMGELLDFMYDTCDDQLRTFIANGFYPDGVGYEASGGYNVNHAFGAYLLDRHVEGLRRLRPEVVRTDRYPAISQDPKFPLIALPFATTTMCDRTAAAYGDDRSPGSMAAGRPRVPALGGNCLAWTGWVPAPVLYREAFHRLPNLDHARVLRRLGIADLEPEAVRLLKDDHTPWPQAGTLLDQGGIGVLRLSGVGRERAAAFIHFVCQPIHRHDDFGDLQLVAFDRTWYHDFGYPVLHSAAPDWEEHWVAHNRAKIMDGAEDENAICTGFCNLFLEGAMANAIEIEGREGNFHEWRLWTPQPRYHRRLVVLLPTVGDGLAMVDCYRLYGGADHWRTFPGLQGRMVWSGATPLKSRPGTAAGGEIEREQTTKTRPGYTALAMIDQIREGPAVTPWKATWFSRDDERWRLDVHGVRCPPETRAITGRGGHPLTPPEQSPYSYTSLLLNAPASERSSSAFDLVFEPYADTPTIRSVDALRPIAGTSDTAGGIRLTLIDGTSRVILWNPDRSRPAAWEGGWTLTGPLAIWQLDAEGKVTDNLMPLDTDSAYADCRRSSARAARGRIISCPDECSILVEPESNARFVPGERIRIFPRGHWYRIVEAKPTEDNQVRLTLDHTRVLSRVLVADQKEQEIVFKTRLPIAWAGYYRNCTLVDSNGASVPIEDIRMREDRPLGYGILGTADPAARYAIAPGSWADLVDFIPGNEVVGC